MNPSKKQSKTHLRPDLIRLLQILMRPEIWRIACRQRVVRHLLYVIRPRRFAKDLVRDGEREHLLDDRTELRPARGTQACEVLVCAEGA